MERATGVVHVAEISLKGAVMKTTTENRSDQTSGNAGANGGAAAIGKESDTSSCCQQAASSFQAAREKARSLTEVALEFVRQHPVRSLLGAFEVGMIVGLLRGRRR
jgi:ElaB/YqjD/DUF883 family membrane-anchored ribosome-binding protein